MAEKVFVFQNVDFKDGMNGATVQYSVGNFTAWACVMKDSEDGEVIAKVSLARSSDNDETDFQIDRTSGVHDIYVKTDEGAEILNISFNEKSPYEEYCYEPAKPVKGDFAGADSWEAVDMLGRRIPSVEDVGAKKDKKVGIFYWTWREHAIHQEPLNLVKLFAEYPAAEYSREHPAWGGPRGWCHWNEPLFGYYRNSDPYVIRRHAVMLASVGVDFMVFDCTNGAFLWRDAYEPLLAELRRCLDDGINVPKIAFMLNFYPGEPSLRMLYFLYQDMYKKGKYKDLWYMHEGKPLIMAFKECISQASPQCDTERQLLDEMGEFFTFRPPQPSYGMKDTDYHHEDHWGWLEIFPQHKYKERPDGSCEMMTVGVAQNANKERICTYFNDKDTFGRSYTNKHGHSLVTKDSYKYGYNFQEQWDRVLDISPDIVFITGWNEWIMTGITGAPWVLDENSTQIAFVDQYDYEHSRDIEPDCDGYLDTYYMQLTANIRRFKGAYPRQKNSEKSIDISGSFSQWKDVVPAYKNPKGLAAKRDFPGFKGCYYKNDTGRNEICLSKACADSEYLYFYAECANDITKPKGDGWMTLFIKTNNSQDGWNGFDFVINRKNPKNGNASVEKYVKTAEENSFTWEEIAKCKINARKNKLVIKLPRALVGLQTDGTAKADFEFKWSDNMINKDVMDFYVNGSCAPYGRFNYRFKI